jgi:hypothetical protein
LMAATPEVGGTLVDVVSLMIQRLPGRLPEPAGENPPVRSEAGAVRDRFGQRLAG